MKKSRAERVANGLLIGVPLLLVGSVCLLYIYAVCSMVDPRLQGMDRAAAILHKMFAWPDRIDSFVAIVLMLIGIAAILWDSSEAAGRPMAIRNRVCGARRLRQRLVLMASMANWLCINCAMLFLDA